MTNPIAPDLVYQLAAVGDPAFSPDASQLAFVRAQFDPEASDTASRIMVMALPGGEAREFTAGPKDSTPRFAPDGGRIAFLRTVGDAPRQLWLISTSGGEAWQLTSLPGGVSEFAWSPDGSRLVASSDVDPDRLPEGADGGHDSVAQPRVRVVRRIKYRVDTVGWRGDAHWHLFVVDATSGTARQLTDGDWDDAAPVWSPDGGRIAFVSHRRDDRDVTPHSEAYVVGAEGGEPVRWSDGLWGVASITWAPEGDQLAVVGTDDEFLGAAWGGAVFVLQPGREPQRLTPDAVKPAAGNAPIAPPPPLHWTRGGKRVAGVLFIGDERGESYLQLALEPGGQQAADSGATRRVAGGGASFTGVGFDANGSCAVVVAATPSSAGDLHLINTATGTMTRLTAVNDGYFADHPTGALEKFSIRRGGLEIECRLVLPPDFDASKRHPLVVDIHGGPHGVFYDAFNAVQQMLATAGYVVLLVNPRGSSTYGADFTKAVLGDWGGEDYLDIMAAVDEVSTRSYIDTGRIGLHGYSYGGFMSAWIVGHDQRFRAAVVGAPCIDLNSMYGTSDIGVSFGEAQWGGRRHEADQALREHSPLTYAPAVETPVLLLHGESDHRCPIEQSEQYFVALKRLGKEVELVRFPGCSHGFLRTGHLKLREEYLARTLGWFTRYVGSESVAAGAAAG